MTKKKLIFFASICVLAVLSCYLFNDSKVIEQDSEQVTKKMKQVETSDELFSIEKDENLRNLSQEAPVEYEILLDKNQNVVEAKRIIGKQELGRESNQIPFSGIATVSKLPETVQTEVNSIVENSNIYYLKQDETSTFMVVDSSSKEEYPRMGIEFVNIDHDGNNVYTVLGYEDESKNDLNSDKESWDFDKTRMLPKRHISYSEDGDINYSEVWNYSTKEPVKYVMKNKDGQVLLMKKEYQDSDSNIRTEHLVYDESGKMKISISISYVGPDITRFTYYNADNDGDGVTIISEYTEGLKSKEEVYSSDYKLKNIYKAEYNDGERANIKILDKVGVELEEILAE